MNLSNGSVIGHDSRGFYAVAVSPDGSRVATGGRNGTVAEWPVQGSRNAMRFKYTGGKGVTRVVYAEQTGALAYCNSTHAYVWETQAAEPIEFVADCTETVAIDPTGKLLFAAGKQTSIRIWSIERRKELVVSNALIDYHVLDSQWIAAENAIVVATFEGTIVFLSASDLKVLEIRNILPAGNPIYRVRLSSARPLMAISFQINRGGPITRARPELRDYYEIGLWERTREKPNNNDCLVGHFSWISALEFSSDGSFLASGGADNSIKIWNTAAGRVISENRIHQGTVHDLAFSANGQNLFSASADGTVRVWTLPDLSSPSYPSAWREPDVVRLQQALDCLLSIETRRELEDVLDRFCSQCVTSIGIFAHFDMPNGPILTQQDINGLNSVLMIRQERAFREADESIARRCSFILQFVQHRITQSVESAIAKSLKPQDGANTASVALVEHKAPLDADDEGTAAVLEILLDATNGKTEGSLEKLIRLEPSKSAFKNAISRIDCLDGDRPLSNPTGSVACARLAFSFAIRRADADLIVFVGVLFVGALGQTGGTTESIEVALALLPAAKNKVMRLQIQSMLGNLYQNAGRPVEGLRVLNEAASEIDAMRGEDAEGYRILAIFIYNNIAVIYRGLGDYLKQRIALDRGLPISETLSDISYKLTLLQNLGSYYLAVGDPASAAQCFREILQSAGVGANLRMMAACDLGKAYIDQDETDKAYICLQEALDLSRSRKAYSVESNALRLLATTCRATGDVTRAVELAKEALDAAEKSDREALVLASEIELSESLLAQEPSSNEAYARLKATCVRAFSKRDSLELPEQGIALHRMVDHLVETFAGVAIEREQVEDAWLACEQSRARILVKQMMGLHVESEFSAKAQLAAVSTSLEALGKNMVLIEYYIGARQSWMFLLRPGERLTVVPIDMTRSRLEVIYENFEREVPGFVSMGDVGEQWAADLQPLANELESRLRPNDHLIVVPNAHLFLMPIHAIKVSGKQMGLQWPISYLPAVALLARNQSSGFVDKRVIIASIFTEEAEDVQKRVSGHLIKEGTKQDYLAALSDANFVHISTHGVFCSQLPEMSGLILGDPSRLEMFYSGISKERYARTEGEQHAVDAREECRQSLLTANDLEAVKFGRDALVVLSACESGLSRLDEAADPNGLTRALLIAGARTIIASFWKVDPETTADLMRVFYDEFSARNWRDPASALLAAERKIAEKRPHTYYWAPFFVLGGLSAFDGEYRQGE
jgi:CHAT domain-containing protein